MSGDRRTILALGGHEFDRRRGNEALVDYMLALAPPEPRVCLLPTASGDAADQIAAFRRAVGARGAAVSDLSLFRREHQGLGLREHLLAQDHIYVGGGSMVNLLAIWRAHGLDRVLREAWERGIVIAGQSAGAMCWFEYGISRSAGAAALIPGLGLVPGILSVHYHRDPDRRRALLEAAGECGMRGFGADDGAGLLVRGRRVELGVRGAEGAGVWAVSAAGEERMEAVALPSPRPAIDEVPSEVIELRAVRASRAGVGARASAGRRRPVQRGRVSPDTW